MKAGDGVIVFGHHEYSTLSESESKRATIYGHPCTLTREVVRSEAR